MNSFYLLVGWIFRLVWDIGVGFGGIIICSSLVV